MAQPQDFRVEAFRFVHVVDRDGDLFDLRNSYAARHHHSPCLVRRGYNLPLPIAAQLLLDQLAEVAQRLPVVFGEFPRLLVHDAKRSDVMAAWPLDWLARVKSYARLVEHDRVLRESRVEHRVLDHHRFLAGYRVPAER